MGGLTPDAINQEIAALQARKVAIAAEAERKRKEEAERRAREAGQELSALVRRYNQTERQQHELRTAIFKLCAANRVGTVRFAGGMWSNCWPRPGDENELRLALLRHVGPANTITAVEGGGLLVECD